MPNVVAQDVVVDDSNDGHTNGTRSPPRENGTDKKDPHSPASARSTPASSSSKKDSEKPNASPGAKVSPKGIAGVGESVKREGILI